MSNPEATTFADDLNLPDLPTPEDFAAMTAQAPLNMAEMDALVTLSQTQWSDYEAKKKIANEALAKYEETEAQIMTALKNAGKSKYHVEGVGTVGITRKMMVRVPNSIAAKIAFMNFLKKEKGDEVMWNFVSVNSNSLNSWYNKEREAYQSENKAELFAVPGLEQPTARESITFRKETKKGSV